MTADGATHEPRGKRRPKRPCAPVFHTKPDVRDELVVLYAEARAGKLPAAEGAQLAAILGQLAAVLPDDELSTDALLGG